MKQSKFDEIFKSATEAATSKLLKNDSNDDVEKALKSFSGDIDDTEVEIAFMTNRMKNYVDELIYKILKDTLVD